MSHHHRFLAVAFSLLWLAGCGVGVEPLMPTPVLFTDCGFDPLSHVPENERWTPRRVYYATNRQRGGSEQKIEYGNKPGDEVIMGLTLIGFGGPHMTWAELMEVSTQSERDEVVRLSVAGGVEAGRVDPTAPTAEAMNSQDLAHEPEALKIASLPALKPEQLKQGLV